MKQIATTATAIILVNQLIGAVHGATHLQLGVDLAPWQQAFVGIVITLAPLVALILYWTPWARTGALVLWTSMLASLVFGVYHHFIGISPDHVSHLPQVEGHGHGPFVLTAVLLIPAEIAGALYGYWSWRKLRSGAA